MSLSKLQNEFMEHVLEEGRSLPGGWNERHAKGLAIYRNGYRDRLVESLRDAYEISANYMGANAFRQIAVHHLLTSPPQGWTVDDAGEGFADVAAELMFQNPEVAELAWLEWALHLAYIAADAQPLDGAGFAQATAGFSEADWSRLQLNFVPSIQQRQVAHDIKGMWKWLSQEGKDGQGNEDKPAQIKLSGPRHLVVWREEDKPIFLQINRAEGAAMAAMQGGATYGELCLMQTPPLTVQDAIAEAGAMLGRWIDHGMIAGINAPV